ncbi:hypothetical protein N7474_010127 [Penicillium riverlandense]|uniref:uncharacterized protein n=1 Tax=Penicillium riverlandense TaxID=1903569 RepID=UPI0025471421|nr:uncharacterized protein N7474_010127 [Penicillium riverlandense]KAJ5808858.1 hypothetical protein N7474_010127 [Penicillium riverlandense]
MADPPVGAPEAPPTYTQGTRNPFSAVNFEPSFVPRKRRSPRHGDEITTSARSNPEFAATGENGGRVTTKELRQLIDSLKEIITNQTAVIESTKADLQEVKRDQQALKSINDELREEVRTLRTQIDGLASTLPTRSWASVAAGTGNPGPPVQHQRPDKDRNCVRISTQRAYVDPQDNEDGEENAFGRYLPTATANTHIRTALLNTSATQDVQVAGIGTTKTGYMIRFKDVESAETARNNTEWLNELGNDTKLVKPRFGIVVHRTPTEGFDLNGDKAGAIEKIMSENELTEPGFQIGDLAWLKKRDKVLGNFASLGIWFDTAEAAQWIVDNGLLVGQRYIGSVEHLSDPSELEPLTMLRTNLRVLQLNIMKSRAGMEALINDHESQNLDVLLIQEPSITAYRTHVNHSAWRLYRPTIENDAIRLRSLIYVSKRISTSSHRQVHCDHSDVTAIKVWTPESQILLFSIYIPPVLLHTPEETSAEPVLRAIRDTIETVCDGDGRPTSIVVSGDFNRHHPTWSGNNIYPRFAEHATELIDFLQAHNLQGCLPRGTPTFWSLNQPGKTSTIDQTVTDNPNRLIKCNLYHENYGSDHRATYSEWDLQAKRHVTTKPRRAYDRADWDKIGEEVRLQTESWPAPTTTTTLDEIVGKLTEATSSSKLN